MDKNIEKLIGAFYKKADEERKKFTTKLEDHEKQEIAISFQENCLKILDYIYTNLPTERKKIQNYCPRPKFEQSIKEYIRENKKFKKKNKEVDIPKEALKFLRHFFKQNSKNAYAISFIVGKIKHEKPNDFGEEGHTNLDTSFMSNHPNPISQDRNGNLSIAGGVIRASAGAKINFHNTKIITPQGSVFFDSLVFSGKPFEDGMIIFNINNKEIRKDFLVWSKECLNICKELINFSNDKNK